MTPFNESRRCPGSTCWGALPGLSLRCKGRRHVGGARVLHREVEIVSERGLNASASAALAQLAAKYLCDVALARGGRRGNAKSLMGVMMLAAGKGSRVVIETDG